MVNLFKLGCRTGYGQFGDVGGLDIALAKLVSVLKHIVGDNDLDGHRHNGGVVKALDGINCRIKKGEKVGRNEPCPCGSGKKYKQWNKKWKFEPIENIELILNPTYFSCGLFSIVRHCPTSVKEDWFYGIYDERMGSSAKSELYKQTAYLCIMDDKPDSFRINKNGKMVCVDYGEFTLSYSCRTGIQHIDYK